MAGASSTTGDAMSVDYDAVIVGAGLSGLTLAVVSSHRRHRWLGDVFLGAVRKEPDFIEEVMARLFERNSAPAVLRFLGEDSSLLHEARLIATLAVPAFLRAAIRRGAG